MDKETAIVVTAAILILLAASLFAYHYYTTQRISGSPTTLESTSTVSAVTSGCFEIPANPTKPQVEAFIGLALNGSPCAIAALKMYQSSNILADYNIILNVTALQKNETKNSNSSNAIYHCPLFLTNPSENDILFYINDTKAGGIAGTCALSALQQYNSSGILSDYGIKLNFSTLKSAVTLSQAALQIQTASLTVHENVTVNSTKLINSYNKVANYYALQNGMLESNNIVENVISQNWAGYVTTSSSDSLVAVLGSWLVQPVQLTTPVAYSSQWVGIGGYSTDNIVQTGTGSDSSAPSYYAWYELYPLEDAITLQANINAGDDMLAFVYLVPGTTTQWNVTISDLSQNWIATGVLTYNVPEASAEWVEERPGICSPSCGLSNLSSFGTAYFGQDSTIIPSTEYACDAVLGCNELGGFPETVVSMANGGAILAQPSGVSSDGTSFNVIRLNVSSASSGGSLTASISMVGSIAKADQGQAVTLLANAVGGAPPYTFNIIIANSVSNSIVASSGNIVGNYAPYPFTTNSLLGSFRANVLVTDSGSHNSVSSSYSSTFAIYNAPSAKSLTSNILNPSANMPFKYNVLISNGIGPFTVDLVSLSNSTIMNVVTLQTNGIATFAPISIPQNGIYRFQPLVTDLGTTVSFAFNGPVSNIIIGGGPVLLASSITANGIAKIDQGEPITFYGSLSGGVPPYQYTFIVSNTQNVIASSTTTNTFWLFNAVPSYTFSTNSLTQTGALRANVVITDSNTPTSTTTNSAYYQFSVNSVPSVSLSVSNSVLDLPQTTTFSLTVNNGIGPFTVNFVYSNGIVADSVNNIASAGTVQYTFSPFPSGTYVFNVITTDTGTTVPYAFNTIQVVITASNALYKPSLVAASPTININQVQVITANLVGSFTPQGDVIVQYSNGLLAVYNASASTNAARGNALLTAAARLSNGASIYLKAETYNMTPGQIDESLGGTGGVNIYGAGKYNTIIESNVPSSSGAIIQLGTNSVTADLSIVASANIPSVAGGVYQFPWGGTPYPNATLRNVYISGGSDGVYIAAGTANSPDHIENVTANTLFDSLNGMASQQLIIYDSLFTSVYDPVWGTLTARGMVDEEGGGNDIISVNTIARASNTVGDYGVEILNGNASIYGGSYSSAKFGPHPGNDLYVLPDTIYINATTTFNSLKTAGSISNTLSKYGPYSYNRSPLPIPTEPSSGSSPYVYNILVYNATGQLVYNYISPYISPSYNSVSFLQNSLWGTGSFTVNVIVTDGATTNEIAENTTTYTADPSTSTTTTIGGGGGGGGGGFGGGGGSALPTVTLNGSCYTIANLTAENQETEGFNGTSLNLVVNFIGPTDAGVSVNGTAYTILPHVSYDLRPGSARYTVDLLNVSWLPVEHTIALNLCGPMAARSATPSNGSSNGSSSNAISTIVPLKVWPGNLTITAPHNSGSPTVSITAPLVSALPSAPPGNYPYLDTAINITVNSIKPTAASISVTLGYNCSYGPSGIAPFIEANGSWSPISQYSVNSIGCTVTFGIPIDPVVALFSSSNEPVQSSIQKSGISTSTRSTSTVPALSSTTILQTPRIFNQSNEAELAVGIGIVAIAVIAVLLLLKLNGAKKPGGEKQQKNSADPPR